MATRSAQQQFGLFALTLALIGLALAVFNWGLQYKMSLYQAHSINTHAPAKLWVGKTILEAATPSFDDQQPDCLTAKIADSGIIFLLFLAAKRSHRPCSRSVPWKLQVRAILNAFSFRPPPVLA